MQDLYFSSLKNADIIARGMQLLSQVWVNVGSDGNGKMSRPGRPPLCYTTLPLNASGGDSLRNSDTRRTVVGRCHRLLEVQQSERTTGMHTDTHTVKVRAYTTAASHKHT